METSRKPVLGVLPEDIRHLTDQGCRKPVLGGLPEDIIQTQMALIKDIVNQCLQ